jgi:hypothetical protein
VDDHVIAGGEARDVGPDRVDDPGRVRSDDVEVGRLTPSRLGLRHVDGHPARRPHVVEVDAGGHDHHERVRRTDLGDLDHLVADRFPRLAEAVGTNQLRVHPSRHLTDGRELTYLVQVLRHGTFPTGWERTLATGTRSATYP